MDITTVGIIGAGNMGQAAARKLAEHVHVILYDTCEHICDELKQEGFQVAASPEAAASGSDMILMFLPGPKEVQAVITGESGLMNALKKHAVIVDHSTVDPDSTKQMHHLLKEASIGYLDAPILGRPERVGQWTFPVGGDEQDLLRAKPVLEILGDRIIPVGAIGSGNVVKLLNNLMFGVINNVTSEILAAAQRLGVSQRVFYDTVVESGAATVSNLFKSIGPKIVDKDFSPVFRVELLYKDMDLGLKIAKQAGATLMVSESAQKLNEIALAKGYRGQDSSIVTLVSDLISKEQ